MPAPAGRACAGNKVFDDILRIEGGQGGYLAPTNPIELGKHLSL